MVKKIIPICVIAFFAVIIFYFFYTFQFFFKQLFFVFFTLGSIGIIFTTLILSRQKHKLEEIKLLRFFLFIFIGIFIGSISFLRLVNSSKPIITLADKKKVYSIKAILTSEPIPAGKKYYIASAKILECYYKNGARFSSSGNIKIFIPKPMIQQNNAFGISMFKNKNACKNFSKGLIFLAKGKLSPKRGLIKRACFFVYKEIPEFIGWKNKITLYRANMRFTLMRLLANWGEAGGLLLALLSANKDFLSETCSNLFKISGLAHILALSGMHVSLISLAAIQMGTVFGKKSIAIKFSLLTIIFFVWFAGSAPSLNRALGMMLILLLGKSLGLTPKMIAVISTMLCIHIILKPEEATSLGFMLSYGALIGIITIGEAVFSILRGKIPPKLLSGISASLGAQIFTTPIIISKIGIVAPIGILASIIISPIVSIFLIGGIFAVFISLIFPFTGFIFSFLLNKLYSVIIFMTGIFATVSPISTKNIINKFIFSIIAIIASIFIIYYSNKIKMRKLCIS